MVEISSWPQAEVPPGVRAQISALQEQAWPSDDGAARGVLNDPELRPLSVVLAVDGLVVSALDILSKPLEHAGRRYAASGLSAVVTDQARRRRGYGTQLAAAALRLIAAGGADVGIFTCDPPLQAFYEGAGWQPLPGAVLVGGSRDEPFPSDQLGKVVLARFFSERARAGAETFARARLELYPGNICKLW